MKFKCSKCNSPTAPGNQCVNNKDHGEAGLEPIENHRWFCYRCFWLEEWYQDGKGKDTGKKETIPTSIKCPNCMSSTFYLAKHPCGCYSFAFYNMDSKRWRSGDTADECTQNHPNPNEGFFKDFYK